MKSDSSLHRRRFIKTFTFATACSSLFGKVWTDILAAEISPLAVASTGTLRIKLPDFPALLSESGSVRLGINPLRGFPPAGPMPNGQFYPVIINRGANNTFYALNSRCTHQSCVVDPMDASSNQINCPCHGSVFAVDGKRLGGPATGALAKYTLKFNGQDALEVQIPGLGYSVIGSSVQAPGTGPSRFRLDFSALRNVDYEVRFRESLDKDWGSVPFSTTPEGLAEQTVFTPTSNTSASLYVERSSSAGFYTVAVRVAEI